MSKFEFRGQAYEVRYCELCESDMLICPACGNNTCNGGYGEIDGAECPSCPTSYDAAYKFWGENTK